MVTIGGLSLAALSLWLSEPLASALFGCLLGFFLYQYLPDSSVKWSWERFVGQVFTRMLPERMRHK